MNGSAATPNWKTWAITLLFALAYTLHSVDRFVIAVVIEPVRHEFHLTDTQLGALGSIAHAIAYSTFVLPVGWLIDRKNRVKLLALMLGLWSGITMLCALANGYWHLFIARMGVGAAESASSPTIQSLVASLFPTKGRASAMGVVFSGVAVGTGIVFAVGGAVADHWGWRYVFLLAGLPGLILAAVIWLFVKEPPRTSRQNVADEAAPSLLTALGFVVKSPPVLFGILGLTTVSMSVASAWTWISPILIRQHGFSLAQAGFVIGLAAGVMKFVSTSTSGFLADWIAAGRINRLWVVPTIALLISFPAALGLTFGTSTWLIIGFTMLLGFTLGTHYSAPRAVIVSVTPARMRGMVASFEQLSVNLIGAGMGPLLTGFLSDYFGGKDSVGLALLATMSLNLIAALSFWLSARTARDFELTAPAPILDTEVAATA